MLQGDLERVIESQILKEIKVFACNWIFFFGFCVLKINDYALELSLVQGAVLKTFAKVNNLNFDAYTLFDCWMKGLLPTIPHSLTRPSKKCQFSVESVQIIEILVWSISQVAHVNAKVERKYLYWYLPSKKVSFVPVLAILFDMLSIKISLASRIILKFLSCPIHQRPCQEKTPEHNVNSSSILAHISLLDKFYHSSAWYCCLLETFQIGRLFCFVKHSIAF